jgi:hypothetical protein
MISQTMALMRTQKLVHSFHRPAAAARPSVHLNVCVVDARVGSQLLFKIHDAFLVSWIHFHLLIRAGAVVLAIICVLAHVHVALLLISHLYCYTCETVST